jgi:hypothetical protein
VKFWAPPEPEKVKSEPDKQLGSLTNSADKIVENKERKRKGRQRRFLSPDKPEKDSPFWCEAHGFSHSEHLPDHQSDCWLER